MRDIQTRTEIILNHVCTSCGKKNPREGESRKWRFCPDCGHSMEMQLTIKICPFCGEDLDNFHMDGLNCDGNQEVLLSTPNMEILYDGDFWLLTSIKSYDMTEWLLKPISSNDAMNEATIHANNCKVALMSAENALAEIDMAIGKRRTN